MSIRWFATLALVSFALSVEPEGQRALAKPRSPAARGSFEIVSCSLGCVPTAGGIGCGTSEIHVNETLRVTFNQPVDPASVNSNSFQMIDAGTGQTPPATFALDPLDPNTLIYRPALFFDSGGNPVFGLVDDRTYLLRIPGTDLDALGPYVTSASGVPNRTRMQCTLVASLGVADAVPGRPTVKIFVQAVLERDPVTGEPLRVGTVPAQGATDVLRTSPIEFGFNDLMNPSTVANPVTGLSSFIHVFFDPDGNVQDRRDQVLVVGHFALTLDQNRNTTRAVFEAVGGLPAAGSQRNPGRVVVELSAQIQDLAANALANPGTTSFTTEAR